MITPCSCPVRCHSDALPERLPGQSLTGHVSFPYTSTRCNMTIEFYLSYQISRYAALLVHCIVYLWYPSPCSTYLIYLQYRKSQRIEEFLSIREWASLSSKEVSFPSTFLFKHWPFKLTVLNICCSNHKTTSIPKISHVVIRWDSLDLRTLGTFPS